MIKILNSVGQTTFGDKIISPNTSTKNWNKFVDDMERNNTYIPEPVRVIYNIGTKAYPILENGKRVKDENGKVKYGTPVKVLTTVVFFDDNTKVSVTNSENDGVKFIQTNAIPGDPESPIVEVADEASKETGFVYASLKRACGIPDGNGNIVGNGFGRKLRDIVNNAYDTGLQEAANKYKNKLAKDKYEAAKGTAKPKRPSFADTVVDLRAATDNLKEMIQLLKADLESVKASK